MLHLFLLIHIHGEDGSHGIHRSNEDSNLTDSNCEQQPPGGLTVGLPLTEDLRQPEPDGADLTEGQTLEDLQSPGTLADTELSVLLHVSVVF